jgi:hypothetical protein
MRRAAFSAIFLLIAAPVVAQPTYVGVVIGADVSRSSTSEYDNVSYPSGDGDAVSGALRVGTSLGPRWGVELEFARPAEIESDSSIGFPIPLATRLGPCASVCTIQEFLELPPTGIFPELPTVSIFPPPDIRASRRNTTLSTVAWVRQQVNDSVDLVYLGGLTFARMVEETEISYILPAEAQLFPARPSSVSRVTTYGIGPVVGVEGRIRMTEHLRLVPGLRLHAFGGNAPHGWLVRPTVGLSWIF